MNAKTSVFLICVKVIIHLLLYDLHDCTFKDHQENFSKHPKVCLINPEKNELGKISKTILDNVNMKLFKASKSTNEKAP